ncbi:MAG: RNA 2',3'-cyclic phosphodiesterase [Candidatus Micrarchaeota archaeon]
MRLFVAIPVPEDIRKKVALFGNDIAQDGVMNVKPENMHLTLKFIGENEQAEQIKKILEKIEYNKFECKVSGVGVFPNESYIKVVWTGIESGHRIEKLADLVKDALINYGSNDRKFSAHLTIARVKKKIDLKEFLIKNEQTEFGTFTAEKFELIQSILSPEGPKYITLASFKLKK